MRNKEIVKKLSEIEVKGAHKELAYQGKIYKFLVFHINKRRLAFHAEQVREILMDVPIFFVPFVPPYIRGFINRHGEPHSVFDMNVLFEKEKTDSSTFLIINLENEQLAFLISDVLEILKVREDEIHEITSRTEHEGFFKGSISPGDEEIFILDLDNILNRLKADIETRG